MNDDQPQDDNVPIDEVSRNKKLFDLFNELLTYSKYFQENIRNLATDMLDSESLKNIIKLKFDLNNTVKKINDYMLGQFPKYPYERSLYVYITLRTEIMTEVKLIRDLLLRDDEKN
jgi:hypothetical protein